MKNLFYIFVLLQIAFTYGCASKSDYQQLRLEFNQLKNDSERLHNDMALFKKAYNPELQEVFSENVLATKNYRKSIEETKYDIERVSEKINFLLRQSENDRALISKNLKTSAAENVVNEFHHLNNQWDTTVYELSSLVRNSEKAVQSSHNAAIQAAEKAGSAERSADYVTEYINLINRQSRSLSRIREKIKNIELQIIKLKKRLDKIEKPKRKKEKEKAVKEK